MPDDLTLSREEAQALYDTLDIMSGGNAENVFAWDGSDSLDDPLIKPFARLFVFLNKPVPASLARD